MSWDILTPRDRLRMEQITTYFENSTIQFQYAYIEDIGDKQGFTGGRIGFISSQSMASLVDGYCKDDSSPKLCSFREVLDRLQATHSPSTRDLGPAFVDAWKAAAMDSRFRSAQDEANYQWYLKPALMTAKTYGVSSVLGREILYDTHVQQGSDWLEKLASRTTQILHGTPMSGVSEARWLKTYLALRRKEQLNPKDKPDPASARVWAETVYRTDFLAKLLKDGNFELNGPIYMDPQDKENTDSIVR